MARLVKLSVENFKKITAIEFEPEGSMTVVSGFNEQGKSSLLDSISVLLGGKSVKIPEPVRRGTKKATITGEILKDSWDTFDSMKITRTITATGNWYLKIEDKTGRKYKSPEGMLKEIFGEPVDPVEFVRMTPADRVETLKRITGLDFSELDTRRKELYDERTLVGREIKQLEGSIESLETYQNVPEEKISVTALLEELEKRQKVNKANEDKREVLKTITGEVASAKQRIDDMEEELKTLQEKIMKAKKFYSDLIDDKLAMRTEVESLQDADEYGVKKQIEDAEDINNRLDANAKFNKESEKLKQKESDYKTLTHKIEKIDTDKQDQLSKIDFPIDGLSFNENDVFYRDLPFNEKQLSSEELLRVSFAIAIAARPNLKNILIREGSILDENNLKLIGQMAEDAGIHVFIEVVGNDAEKATILIENGEIKQPGSEYDENDFSDI